MVANAATCQVINPGNQALGHGDRVDGFAEVVQNAGAGGAVVGKADFDAAGVGVALDATVFVVIDGVA
ncbi:hypothetical protein [Comamonas sp.]|uniref:hypothetical protein n=1 Tax=Comamonas sp. TaxID=34028 RepID=UPI002FC744CA